MKARLPVRSAIYKQCTGGLVVRWVTTSESPLLYVFAYLFVPCVRVIFRHMTALVVRVEDACNQYKGLEVSFHLLLELFLGGTVCHSYEPVYLSYQHVQCHTQCAI